MLQSIEEKIISGRKIGQTYKNLVEKYGLSYEKIRKTFVTYSRETGYTFPDMRRRPQKNERGGGREIRKPVIEHRDNFPIETPEEPFVDAVIDENGRARVPAKGQCKYIHGTGKQKRYCQNKASVQSKGKLRITSYCTDCFKVCYTPAPVPFRIRTFKNLII